MEWTVWERQHSISGLELAILVIACATWGPQWSGRRIRFFSDNEAVCYAVRKRRCTDVFMSGWLRTLHFIEAQHSFSIRVDHLPGKENVLADAISRRRFDLFRTSFIERFGVEPDDAPVTPVMPRWP